MVIPTESLTYWEQIEAALRGENDGTVHNFDSSNARDLMTAIFKRSHDVVDILSERLSPEVYDQPEIMDAAAEFLVRGGRLRIAIERPIPWTTLRERPFIEAVICRGNLDGFNIRVARNALERHRYNFAVGDRRRIRFEEDRDSITAVGMLDNPEKGAWLADRFEEIWRDSVMVEGRGPAPARIDLVHEFREGTHLFLSPKQLPGLNYGSFDFDEGLDAVANVAGALVSLQFGISVTYRLVRSSDRSGSGNYLELVGA